MLSVLFNCRLHVLDSNNDFSRLFLDFISYHLFVRRASFRVDRRKLPACSPVLFLLFLRHVLVVLIRSHSSLCEGSGRTGTTPLGLVEFTLDFGDLGVSFVSENLLDTGNDANDVDDLLNELLNTNLELFMRGFVDDLPSSVKNCVNSEDRHQLLPLLIAVDVLGQVEQGVFDRLFEGLHEALV